MPALQEKGTLNNKKPDVFIHFGVGNLKELTYGHILVSEEDFKRTEG